MIMNWLCQVFRLVWSLSSLINLFDYHQRVPTQIDRFKLLKSLLFRGLPLKADGHSSDLNLSVKHFFAFYFEKYFLIKLKQMIQGFWPLTTAEALCALPCQWGGIIEILFIPARSFLKFFSKRSNTKQDAYFSPYKVNKNIKLEKLMVRA